MPAKAIKIAERFISRSSLGFSSLPDKVKTAFFAQMVVKQFKRGQNIFTEGTFPAGIYFIKSGKVKKYKTLDGGNEQIIYICAEGELFGYAALLGEERYPDSAAALSDASIGFVSKEKLMQLLEHNDELMKMLVKNLSHEFGILVNFIAVFNHKSVRERVALILLILEEKFRDNLNENGEIQIVLTREDFANMAGTAVETLVRLLHDLKEEKIIETQGRKIIIKQKSQLFKIADVTDVF